MRESQLDPSDFDTLHGLDLETEVRVSCLRGVHEDQCHVQVGEHVPEVRVRDLHTHVDQWLVVRLLQGRVQIRDDLVPFTDDLKPTIYC